MNRMISSRNRWRSENYKVLGKMTSKILGFSLVFAILFGLSSAYKMVIFVPNLSNSQVQFCARVAQTLSGAGHDVTMLFVNHFEDFEISVKIPDGVKKHYLNAIVKGASKTELEKEQAKLIFKDSSVFDPEMFRMMKKFTGTLQEGCRLAIRDPHFLPWLKSEKFDLAFTYIYSTCPLGFVHLANIPFVWLNSGPLMDFVAQSIGVPTFPSYIPPVMMEATDSMTFFERTKSFIGHFMSGIVSRHLIAKQETQIFRDELNDPNFPETLDIGAKCPLVMVNTNPIYDLPRPLLAKVIPIGGLGVGFGDAKPLQPDFQKIATTGKGVVVFSFGSVAAAHEMPVEWKNALLETFADFPDYQFVMRYVDNDIRDRLPKNVHIFKWLPQKDLLLHNNTKAFITHGGYNSMQEAISAGVPLMTIALFGDQPKNSKIAAKHGIAVNINKATLSKATISDGLRKLLTDSSYSLNVKKLSAMVRRQPIKSDDLLIKWSEFAAEFKTLENLQPKSVELNVFQLFSLDVIAFLISLAALLVFLIYQLLRVLWVAIFGKKSPKIKVN